VHFLRLKLSPTPAVKYIDGNYLAVHEDEDEDEDGTPPEEKSHVLDVSFMSAEGVTETINFDSFSYVSRQIIKTVQ